MLILSRFASKKSYFGEISESKPLRKHRSQITWNTNLHKTTKPAVKASRNRWVCCAIDEKIITASSNSEICYDIRHSCFMVGSIRKERLKMEQKTSEKRVKEL